MTARSVIDPSPSTAMSAMISAGPREAYIQAVLGEGRRLALADAHSDAEAAGLAVVALCLVDGTPQASIGYGGVGNALQNDRPSLAAVLRDLAAHVEDGGAT